MWQLSIPNPFFTKSCFLNNGLGSAEAITDGTGTVTDTYKYDMFGGVRRSRYYVNRYFNIFSF